MKKNLIAFLIGVIIVPLATLTVLVFLPEAQAQGPTQPKAPGDIIYEVPNLRKCISAAQAVCYANCAIADESWDGSAANLYSLSVHRGACEDKQFWSQVSGVKSAHKSLVPDGVIFRGVEP